MRPRTARIVFGGVLIACMLALATIAIVAWHKGNEPLPVATAKLVIYTPMPTLTEIVDDGVSGAGLADDPEQCAQYGDGWRSIEVGMHNADHHATGQTIQACAAPSLAAGLHVKVSQAPGGHYFAEYKPWSAPKPDQGKTRKTGEG